MSKIVLEGAIAGLGFASGDTFVAGMWDSGPLGAMTDVMWSQPDRRRVLAGAGSRHRRVRLRHLLVRRDEGGAVQRP